MQRTTLPAITLTLTLGVLLGIACSNGGVEAVADAAADLLRADEIGFDGTASGLDATTVQAAVDALAAALATQGVTLEDHGARLAVVEASRPASATRYDGAASGLEAETVQAAVDALAAEQAALGAADAKVAADVSSLEAEVATLTAAAQAPKTAGDVGVAAIDGLDAATVQEALAALQSKVAAQEAKVAALEAALAKVGTCPEGFVGVSDACVELKPRTPTGWPGAAHACGVDGLRMCSYEEYLYACMSGISSTVCTGADLEWTSTWVSETSVLGAKTITGAWLAIGAVPLEANPLEPVLRPYRCCRNR